MENEKKRKKSDREEEKKESLAMRMSLNLKQSVESNIDILLLQSHRRSI